MDDGPAIETPTTERQGSDPSTRGEKRKFSLDEDELARIALEERGQDAKATGREKVRTTDLYSCQARCVVHEVLMTFQAAKPTLPSFWVPSVTPSSNKNDILHDIKKKIKSQPVCPASPDDKPHFYSLHTLVTINFEEEADSKTRVSQRICPACRKALSNSSKATLAKPCGHVLCGSCVNQFMKASGYQDSHAPELESAGLRCYVCEADLVDKPKPDKKERDNKEKKERIKPGLVEIRCEGTGFSAGGSNQVKKGGVNFQC